MPPVYRTLGRIVGHYAFSCRATVGQRARQAELLAGLSLQSLATPARAWRADSAESRPTARKGYLCVWMHYSKYL